MIIIKYIKVTKDFEINIKVLDNDIYVFDSENVSKLISIFYLKFANFENVENNVLYKRIFKLLYRKCTPYYSKTDIPLNEIKFENEFMKLDELIIRFE